MTFLYKRVKKSTLDIIIINVYLVQNVQHIRLVLLLKEQIMDTIIMFLDQFSNLTEVQAITLVSIVSIIILGAIVYLLLTTKRH